MNVASLFSDQDLYLFNEGTWVSAYEKMGAHLRVVDGVRGTNLAVWAPNAERVSVIGDFNGWQPAHTPLARRGQSGIWEAFVPELAAGRLYKYSIRSRHVPYEVSKADPYGFASELRPATASIVYDIGGYAWGDKAWLAHRATQDQFSRPIAVYEAHLGSWRRAENNRFLTYRELAHQLVDYVTEHGFTHIELLPIAEHPYDGSWGYQTTGYFAPTSRYGTPHDLMYLIDQCHQNGIGVFLDWVPAHYAKDAHGLGLFDGTHLYEHADPRQGQHLKWGTYVFNYCRPEVLTFLLSNAHYWLREYHIDGMRVDAVASLLYLDYDRDDGAWVANRYGGRENLEAIDFLRRFNDLVDERHPGALTCAEESTAWPGVTAPTAGGGLGFDLKWNMGWMHDTLSYVARDAIFRRYHHNEITFSFTYAFSERYILPLSHDEVVHLKHALIDKMPGDRWQKFATLRALYAFMYGHPGKKLLFMGDEFAQWHEWAWQYSLDWHLLEGEAGLAHRQMQQFVSTLNRLYRTETALYERDTAPEGFAWIDGSDSDHSVVAFLRRGASGEDTIALVANWTPVVRHNYPIGVPLPGRWVEVLNSDAAAYGGSGIGNEGGVMARAEPLDGYDYALSITLPPLAVLWLTPAPTPASPPTRARRSTMATPGRATPAAARRRESGQT